MARRGVPRSPGYISGSHWFTCDSCGFQFRESEGMETWDGFWVCDDDFEVRHPQDFLRIRPEQISVSEPLRAEDISNVAPDTTLGPVTTKGAFFANTSAVAGSAEAGLAVCGTDDGIPTATFGLVQGLTNPEV